MVMDLAGFKAQLQGDGARPNLFEIVMPFPAIISPGNASQKLRYMARAAQLPGSSIGTTPVYYMGREVKLAGNRTFADWNITVLNDTDFAVRNAFERWQSAISGHLSNQRNAGFVNLSNYSVDATVRQLDMNNKIIKTYTMHGIWPNDTAPIDLDWSANDSIEEFTVSLVVQDWVDFTNGVI